MSDASAKMPSGLAEGATHWVGNFDQCFANLPPSDFVWPKPPRSHYCQLPAVPPGNRRNIVFYIGVCAPDTCLRQEVAAYINVSLNGRLYVREGSLCWKRPEEIPLTKGATVMICIIGITALLVILSTIFDALQRRTTNATAAAAADDDDLADRNHRFGNEMLLTDEALISTDDEILARIAAADGSPGICKALLLSFSVITNWEKLWDTTAKAGRMGCLDGVRFLSMTWIILGHTFFFIIYDFTSPMGVLNSVLEFKELVKKWSFQTIYNASFSVDTFFVLSGVLTSYYFLKETEAIGTINSRKFWYFFYVHRFLRLTPVYMFCIGFYTCLVKYFSTGPFWNQTNFFSSENCKEYWWTNLLYINNFVRPTEACMGWTWFLAVGMQLHVIVAPILLSLFFFCRLLSNSQNRHNVALYWTMFLPFLAVLISLFSSWMIYKDGIDNKKTATQIFDDYYIVPWCRMSPYIVGLAVGFLILLHEKKKFTLHKTIVILGWIVSAGLCLSVLYGLSGVAAGTYKNSNTVTALYWAMSRFVWALGVSWVMFACLAGNGGWIDTFLAWRGFAPLSRLTYCAYLIHPIVIAVVYSSLRQAQVLTTFGVVCFFFAHLVMTYMVALIISLLWESPIRAIERALRRKS